MVAISLLSLALWYLSSFVHGSYSRFAKSFAGRSPICTFGFTDKQFLRSWDGVRAFTNVMFREPEKPRVKKYKFWDIAPAGYEHLTPKEYKDLQVIHKILMITYFLLYNCSCRDKFLVQTSKLQCLLLDHQ